MKISYNPYKTTGTLLLISCAWIIFEGALRKWLLPSISSQLFALKYVLFITTYLFHYLTSETPIEKIKKPFQMTLFLVIAWCGFSYLFYSPLNSPFLVKTMGIVNYLFFIPLISVIPKYIDDVEKFEKIIINLLYISLPLLLLGVIQYYLPTDHFLNTLVNEEQKISRVSGYTRVLSIFTFVKIYNVYLLFIIPVFFSYLFYRFYYGGKTILIIFIIALGLLNTIMTGSRLPTFLCFCFILLILGYLFVVVPNFRSFIIFTIISTSIASLFLISNVKAFKDSTSAFMERTELQEELGEKGHEDYTAKERLIDRLDIYKYADEAGMLGFGIGTTYQGTGFYLSKHRPDIKYEEEGERVVLEIGVIGATLILLLRITILIYSLKLLFLIKNIKYALFLTPLVLYLVPETLFINNLTFNYFDNFSYWCCFGLILSIKNIHSNYIEKKLENTIHS